jgi:hypothetical protein
MNLNDVQEFIKNNRGLKTLELQDGDFSIKLEWNCGGEIGRASCRERG